MADLATCYFCGTAEAAIEEHPVIPQGLDPSDDRQRTVAACPECRRKFERAIEPLVAALRDRDVEDSTTERESMDPDGESVETDDATDEPPTGGEALDEPVDEPDEDGRSEGGEDRPGRTDESVELPDAARDVLRLLQNREFPVDRGEISTVATNAYELAPGEASDAIDALVERGVLVEEDGRLDRSR